MNEKEHKYCSLCAMFVGCPFNNCHGREFYRMDQNRQGMNQGAYIPKAVEDRFHALESTATECRFKHLTPLDSGKIGLTLAVLEYGGKKPRQSLKSIEIWIADIGQSGKTFVDVYLRECLSNKDLTPYPLRVKRKGNRIYNIERNEKL